MNSSLSPSSNSGSQGSNRKEATQALRRQRASHRAGRSSQGENAARLPSLGEQLFGFRLRSELGRGAFARVFLAEQAELAGRPVVIKVSGIAGDEPQTLAQLQHTHIVPIYSVHEDPGEGLRAVCMPYFGGASLSRILEILFAKTPRPTLGSQFTEALAAAQPVKPNVPSTDGSSPSNPAHAVSTDPSPLMVLEKSSYIRAGVWVLARLAEGLHHAHQRGVLHRDIKPSNILICADGQPMLLDFNVSQSNTTDRESAILGGTVAYSAPEHLKALASRDLNQSTCVDHRSDIYSLGLVLYEFFVGQRPFSKAGSYSPLLSEMEIMVLERSRDTPSLRIKRPDVSWGLESILRQCLAPNPRERYQRSDHLAEDLRRYLDDFPLKYAPELSRRERVQKWLRRHPRISSSAPIAALAGVMLLGTGAGLFVVQGHLQETQAKLEQAESEDRQQQYQEGTTKALCLINTVVDVQDNLREGHKVCEATLSLYSVLDRDDWQDQPNWHRLGDERPRLSEDTRELLLLLAWSKVRLQPGNEDVLRESLALLDRAEAIRGLTPSRALLEDRAVYLEQLGRSDEADTARAAAREITPNTARDHYLLATTFAHRSRYQEAIAELDRALQQNPGHYWSLVQRGICYQELGKYSLASADFGTCVGLWPTFAWGYFNRAYVLDRSGEKNEAIRDYTSALECDSNFLPAYLNRALAHLERREFSPALSDFDKAVELGRDDASLHAGRGAALEGLGRSEEADRAFETAQEKSASVTPDIRMRIHLLYGFSVAARLPEKAREAFQTVLQQQPQHAQAYYGIAMLLAEEKQLGPAVSAFDRALESDPNFTAARRFRAVLLARQGKFDLAGDDINRCLEKEPGAGITLYAGACVAALAAEKTNDPTLSKQAIEQGVELLRQAFAVGYGKDKADTDEDLAGLRKHPQFQALLSKP